MTTSPKRGVGRRRFLQTLVVSAGAASVGVSVSGCAPSRPAAEVFPQSVASGDPRPDSIVLWTRAVDDPAMPTEVTLELATDEAFDAQVGLGGRGALTALPEHDHCLRVKVTGLEAGQIYYYRFVANDARSHVGRFRSAPAADADTPIRFGVLSCQDFVGRYYNTLLRLLDAEHDDLDFVVHLGDYVYETTGDPGFMMVGGSRGVAFEDEAGAIALDGFFAARSVSNYRDLYKTFRGDELLQRLHERFAFVVTWDDHEFSDDAHGATATYSDGVLDETDTERRVNAEQAFFEYMPVARDGEDEGVLTAGALYPDNQLYRDLRFGRHLTLAMTDYRSFRPDHPTPEDAYPGAVVLTESEVRAALAQLVADGELEGEIDVLFEAGGYRRYVDLAELPDHAEALRLLLVSGYTAEGVDADRAAALATRYAAGAVDAGAAQSMIAAGRDALPAALQGIADLDPDDDTLPRGLPYLLMGKTGLTGQLGARYLVVQRTYELAAAHRFRVQGDTSSDDVYGADQEAWLRTTLEGAETTWSVVGNSVNHTSLVLDLTPLRGSLPEGLPAERMLLNVDHWDGFPEKRRQMMNEVFRPANAVLIAGDIHACLGTDFGADADGNRVIELTTPGVSSGSWKELLGRTANSVQSIRESGLVDPVLGALDRFQTDAFPPLKVARSETNGVMVVSLDGAQLQVDWHLLPEEAVSTRHYDAPEALEGMWERITQVVPKEGGKNGPMPGLPE